MLVIWCNIIIEFSFPIFSPLPLLYRDLQDYKLPAYFAEEFDFMNQVEDELRMDWRWIIMAPKRSGSGWHVDPANTTGWLGLVTGAKLWGMYPPTTHHVPGAGRSLLFIRTSRLSNLTLKPTPSFSLAPSLCLSLSLPIMIYFISPLQPHQKFKMTQYEELGLSWLIQMKDDFTTNSTTSLVWLWECNFWTWERKD